MTPLETQAAETRTTPITRVYPKDSQARVYMGIDPGVTGAVAIYGPEYNNLLVYDMPNIQRKVGRRLRKELDIAALVSMVDTICSFAHIERAWIEDVHSLPKQGVTSAFTFGQTFGATLAVLYAGRIPHVRVQPQSWKRHFKLIGQPKDQSRAVATRFFPTYSAIWARKMDHGRAEAALLAFYGSRQGI